MYAVSLTSAVMGIFFALGIDLITHHCSVLSETQYSKLDIEINVDSDGNSICSNNKIKLNSLSGFLDYSVQEHHANDSSTQIGYRTQMVLNSKVYMLESAIAIHSVIIGFGFGSIDQNETKKIEILTLAFCFHQFFEGIGLATAVAKSTLKIQDVIGFGLVFSLSYPVGALIGVSTVESSSSVLFQGFADAFASGILIQAALVEMINEDFSQRQLNSQPMLKLAMFICLLLGFGCMGVLACFE